MMATTTWHSARMWSGFSWCISALIFLAASPGAAEADVVELWEIQGTGDRSPYIDRFVTTQGNVVTAVGANGFFMQVSPEHTDGDPATSDGIFVYTGGLPAVQCGDIVTVSGRVAEYYGMTEFSRQGLSLAITGRGPIPALQLIEGPFPGTTNDTLSAFEAYEGMLVQIVGATATGPPVRYYAGQLREELEVPVVLGHPRPFREPGFPYPAQGEPPAVELFDNNPEVFEIGFGGGARSTDFADLEAAVVTGAQISAAGPVVYRFGRYQMWPLAGTLTVDATFSLSLPRPVSFPQSGELTIASQNVLNLFDPLDDPGKDDIADTPTPEEYEHRLNKLAAQVCDVLRTPDVVALQEVEKMEVLDHPDAAMPDLVSAIQARCGILYAAYLIEGYDERGIDNAYLVRSTQQVLSVSQIGVDEMFTPSDGSAPERLFARPPLVLEAILTSLDTAFPITVINVHNRSYLDSELARNQEQRYQEALYLAHYVQARQEDDPDAHLVVVGDFNAPPFNDGIAPIVPIIAGTVVSPDGSMARAMWWPDQDWVEPDLLIQTVLRVDPSERYSTIYDGSAESFDHILTTQTLDRFVVRVEYSRGNADAPLDFAQDTGSPLRSSDHDGVIIAIQILPPTVQPEPTATRLPLLEPTSTSPPPTATPAVLSTQGPTTLDEQVSTGNLSPLWVTGIALVVAIGVGLIGLRLWRRR